MTPAGRRRPWTRAVAARRAAGASPLRCLQSTLSGRVRSPSLLSDCSPPVPRQGNEVRCVTGNKTMPPGIGTDVDRGSHPKSMRAKCVPTWAGVPGFRSQGHAGQGCARTPYGGSGRWRHWTDAAANGELGWHERRQRRHALAINGWSVLVTRKQVSLQAAFQRGRLLMWSSRPFSSQVLSPCAASGSSRARLSPNTSFFPLRARSLKQSDSHRPPRALRVGRLPLCAALPSCSGAGPGMAPWSLPSGAREIMPLDLGPKMIRRANEGRGPLGGG